MTQLLDSNVLMEAGRHYDRFGMAPGFWDWLGRRAASGDVASVEAVRDEIGEGDELGHWARALPSAFWRPVGAGSLAWGVELVRWVKDTERGLRPEAIEAFLDSADFFLICEALATGSTVVTREVSASGSRRVIKIPDVCSAFDVPCHQPFDVFERLGLRLLV